MLLHSLIHVHQWHLCMTYEVSDKHCGHLPGCFESMSSLKTDWLLLLCRPRYLYESRPHRINTPISVCIWSIRQDQRVLLTRFCLLRHWCVEICLCHAMIVLLKTVAESIRTDQTFQQRTALYVYSRLLKRLFSPNLKVRHHYHWSEPYTALIQI